MEDSNSGRNNRTSTQSRSRYGGGGHHHHQQHGGHQENLQQLKGEGGGSGGEGEKLTRNPRSYEDFLKDRRRQRKIRKQIKMEFAATMKKHHHHQSQQQHQQQPWRISRFGGVAGIGVGGDTGVAAAAAAAESCNIRRNISGNGFGGSRRSIT